MIRRILTAFAATVAFVVSAAGAEIVADICVYGATSGGVTASVQAARQGKSVVLLATGTQIGGMTSGGLGDTDVGISASIGGMALEFYERIGTRYGVSGPKFNFEPHVAREEFLALLDAAGVIVRTNQRLGSVTMAGPKLTQLTLDDGTIVKAGMFIDTTYEGDLMAAAGVTWTMGRESAALYGESLNGVTVPSGPHQFSVNVDPYLVPGNPASGLLPLLQPGTGGPPGAGDSGLQAYNFRLCLTSTPANRRPIDAPPGYDEARYELLARLIEARLLAGQTITINDFMTFASMPGQKSDNNNNGPISTDYIGGNVNYVTASHAERAQIAQQHLEYIQGFLYFLGHSTRVPVAVRNQMLSYGTCLDEFPATNGWPDQLYVREARRMISDYVMQQGDCVGTRMAEDSIALGSYTIDSHTVQRVVKNGAAWNEGLMGRTIFEPYRISYRSIVPRVGECENLLAPWALSASHVAFGSIRMEPVFMILSQSAGAAAAFALDEDLAVQQVPYAKLALQLTADRQKLSWNSDQPLGTVLDTTDPVGVTITGAWASGTAVHGFAGADYLHDGNTDKGLKSVRFTPTLTAGGDYDIYLRWTSATNRAANAPVAVTHSGGVTNFTVDQRQNGGTWYKLTSAGPLNLPAGTTANVLVHNGGTTNFVVADAVRFVPFVPPVATVQIVASDPTANEADAGNRARFTVVRPTGQTSAPWEVPYSVTGTATAGSDFAPLAGTVTIPAGAVAAAIEITPLADGLAEGVETVTVTLGTGVGFTVGALDSATARITDPPAVSITATDASASEAPLSDTALFTISRPSSAAAVSWTVAYTVSGSATEGSDFAALPGSVTLSAGQVSTTVPLTAIADLLPEGPETITLSLTPDTLFTAGPPAIAVLKDRPIDDWRFANFTPTQLADELISGEVADPDADGHRNFTEYALGLNPLRSDPTITTSGWDGTGRLTLTYLQRRSATDVTVVAEGSIELQTWSAAPEMVEEIAREPQGEFDVVTVRLVPIVAPSGFLRVRVTRP